MSEEGKGSQLYLRGRGREWCRWRKEQGGKEERPGRESRRRLLLVVVAAAAAAGRGGGAEVGLRLRE